VGGVLDENMERVWAWITFVSVVLEACSLY
jgi:hypothetical protein